MRPAPKYLPGCCGKREAGCGRSRSEITKMLCVTLRFFFLLVPQSGCGIKCGINTTRLFWHELCGCPASRQVKGREQPLSRESSRLLVMLLVLLTSTNTCPRGSAGRWGCGDRPGGTGDPKQRKWRQRWPTPRASVTPLRHSSTASQQQPVAPLVATLLLPVSRDRSDRQLAATARTAAAGSSRQS